VIAPKMPVGPSGIAHRLLIKKPIVFSDYWSAYRAVIPSEQQRLVGKEMGEAAHTERWNNTLRQHLARFLRKTLSFPKCVRIMKFVQNSSYTAIIPNYCRLLARYHFKNHHYPLKACRR